MRFLTLTGNGDYGISVFDMATRKTTKLIDLPGSAQHSSAVSPDGRWMAYASNETGRYEVWLEPLPSNGTRYQLTRSGGSHPLWSADGKSLYFDRTRQLFQLPVNTAQPSSSAEPVALPIKGFVQAEYRRQFDLMPNGRQFLVLIPLGTQGENGSGDSASTLVDLWFLMDGAQRGVIVRRNTTAKRFL
jgi:dipeptidyl aminopeptidase/acylaminoacyl peptidase